MAYLLLCRVWNALIAAGVCVCSFFIIRNNFEINYYEVLFLSLGIFFLVCFANAHNDIIDFEIDKINRPKRPLPSGKISVKAAYRVLGILLFFTMFFGILAGVKFAFLFLFAILLSIAYNRFLKGLPLIGNFTVALLSTTPVIIPIINFGLPQPELSVLTFFAFMLTFAREITKDIEDMEGDKSKNLKTFPLLTSINLSLFLVFIIHFQCLFQIAMFKPFLLIGAAPFIALSVIFAILKKWHLSQNMLKLAMLGGLITFLPP
ncbi:MAG: geranylgeranylglycerol-phosphate geranylgeranyltransferase [Fibromonadaceae bacterium]|jgi:4-hydroxybenzoate polyprenyltransferase|nr:geranylgeranylglycerol-phosphate geranylgeranyltransferase [Fibromonadaceae bacterium]